MTPREGRTLVGARRQVAILSGLVFVAGAIAGLLLSRPMFERSSRTSAFTGTDRVFYEQFSRDFDLDREQRRKLRIVLEDRRGRLNNWHNDLRQITAGSHARRRLLRINRLQDSRIRALLTDTQRRRYDAAVAHGQPTKNQ